MKTALAWTVVGLVVAMAVAGSVVSRAQRVPATSSMTNKGLTAVAGIRVGHHTLTERPTGCTVVVVARPGAEEEEPPGGWRWLRVEVPRLDVSSTDLRARVLDGRPLDYLIPPDVIACIRDRGLYAPAIRP